MDAGPRVERIKACIDQAEYLVDVDAVADAILRRLLVIPPESGGRTPPDSPHGQTA
jgi:Anti-sigma-28 factor, FlgM